MPRKTPVEPTPKDTDCGCSFQFDADGRPEIICPDEDSQDLVFAALRAHPDLAVRINALQPANPHQTDEELGPEDDSEFDDNDDLEEVEEDDLLPF